MRHQASFLADAQLDGLTRLLTEQEDAIVEALRIDLGRARFDVWPGDIASTSAEIAHARKHLRLVEEVVHDA